MPSVHGTALRGATEPLMGLPTERNKRALGINPAGLLARIDAPKGTTVFLKQPSGFRTRKARTFPCKMLSLLCTNLKLQAGMRGEDYFGNLPP